MVISETLKGNKINGVLIAITPLITDLPIVLFSIYLLSSFSNIDLVLGILSIFGGVFLIYLAISNFKFKPKINSTGANYSSTIKYGVIANILSPHPYLFWITIGAPTFVKASKSGGIHSLVFILGFYVFLIGSKIAIAIISGEIKGLLNSDTYKNTMKFMGIILLLLGGIIIYEGCLMIWNVKFF